MIPNTSRETLPEAMETSDKKLRDADEWSNWEQRGTHKYATEQDGQRYPVKQIIRMATRETNLSGGDEANNYAAERGMTITPLSRHQR